MIFYPHKGMDLAKLALVNRVFDFNYTVLRWDNYGVDIDDALYTLW